MASTPHPFLADYNTAKAVHNLAAYQPPTLPCWRMLYLDNDEERTARVERILEELARMPAPSTPIKVQAIATGLLNAATPTLIVIAKQN